jgi:salicylate hydroxylase
VADRRTIVIAGAGIGGLTAALALDAAGFPVVVCERAAELSELGAGIQLSPNAGRVLAELGLDAAVAKEAVEPVAIDVYAGHSGRRLTSLAAQRFRERYGLPYRVIHRADLQAVLAEAALHRPGIGFRLGATVGPIVAQSSGPLVRIERSDGNEVVAAGAVIGADGIWSAARKRVAGAGEPLKTGRTAWRSLIAVDMFPHPALDRVTLWLGAKAHLVTYPVARGSAVNIVAIVEENWTKASWSAAGEPEELEHQFDDWCAPVRDIVAAPTTWQKWPVMTIDPSTPWVDGPVALLGDAAHAMAPFVAQGGAMAIEDAIVLARCLATKSDAASALAAYEAERKPRVLSVAQAATQTGELYHGRGARAFARDLALRIAGRQLILRRNDWIYRWNPDHTPNG